MRGVVGIRKLASENEAERRLRGYTQAKLYAKREFPMFEYALACTFLPTFKRQAPPIAPAGRFPVVNRRGEYFGLAA